MRVLEHVFKMITLTSHTVTAWLLFFFFYYILLWHCVGNNILASLILFLPLLSWAPWMFRYFLVSLPRSYLIISLWSCLQWYYREPSNTISIKLTLRNVAYYLSPLNLQSPPLHLILNILPAYAALHTYPPFFFFSFKLLYKFQFFNIQYKIGFRCKI